MHRVPKRKTQNSCGNPVKSEAILKVLTSQDKSDFALTR